MRKILALILLLIGVAVLLYFRSQVTPQTFSSYTLLTASWQDYKDRFITDDGRVVDHLEEVTTSEGQSYALLRAVFIDDKQTFDRVWDWSRVNLKRPNDELFAWRWGQRSDGTYGFMESGGENSASDADVDIALALIFASRRWNQQVYLDEARKIVDDIWEIQTADAGGVRYLTAGNWAIGQEEIIVNPSYFAPYAWRVFAEVDTENDWNSLVDPAYDVLFAATSSQLDKQNSVGLPPDWLSINRENGVISATDINGLTTNYSYDAMRVPFRIALDYKWNNEPRAMEYLSAFFKILEEDFKNHGRVAVTYTHDGVVLEDIENPAMYATSLGYFMLTNPELARTIYEEKIMRLYASDRYTFHEDIPYYEQNWLWFGAAFYNDFLTNLMK